MKSPRPLRFPDWVPSLEPGTRVLVAGASGGLGRAFVKMLSAGSDCVIGVHGASGKLSVGDKRIIPIRKTFKREADCRAVVNTFCDKAGGIDALICLSGAIEYPGHWEDISEKEWEREMTLNLSHPFFLARAAMAHMKKQKSGGRIILNGTESALHGGSPVSLPYAVAKRGTECLVQGMAREGAPHNILVNGVRFGFIESGFHQRWHKRTSADMRKRAEMVLLKRGGHPDEAAALMIYLLSGWSQFITGQMIPLTGGDWL